MEKCWFGIIDDDDDGGGSGSNDSTKQKLSFIRGRVCVDQDNAVKHNSSSSIAIQKFYSLFSTI